MYLTQSLQKNFEKGINPRLLQHDDMSLLFELAWKLQCTWEPVALALFDIERHWTRWKICPGMQSSTPMVKSTNSNWVSMVEILLIKEHLPRTVTPALHIHRAHCHTHTQDDNYFHYYISERGSGAVGEMVEDIMKTRGREINRKRRGKKKLGGQTRTSTKCPVCFLCVV